jgi:hypothetical protein
MDKNNETVEKIVSIEWDMFSAVNEGETRASCQENRAAFEGMRSSQFSAWPGDAASSYLDDLRTAERDGRNLVEEKYIHMMMTTEPSQFIALIDRILRPSDLACSLAQEITDILLMQTRELFDAYPNVAGKGRPLHTTDDGSETSVETYQFCELITYSERTLAALRDHIIALEKDGASFARLIMENTVRFFGYESLDSAEEATVKRMA